MADELIGKDFGGYTIESWIGRGGMATVYLAKQKSMNRVVALKVLPRDLMQDPSYLARFEREVDIAAQLEHRNIVPVYDYGEYQGQPYIVMRYMPGGSVDDRLANGPLTMEDMLKIVEQIAPALDFAHSKNVLHRDLKPSNILLDNDGGAFLTDFGIARITGGQAAGATITTDGVVGTPSYMSPEQAQGHSLDERSDIYSFGITLFEMATAQRPFQSDTPYSIAVMQVTTPPPSPRKFNADVTVPIEQVIHKALKKRAEDRYQTAVALADALKMAVERPSGFMHDTQPSPIDMRNALGVTQPNQPIDQSTVLSQGQDFNTVPSQSQNPAQPYASYPQPTVSPPQPQQRVYIPPVPPTSQNSRPFRPSEIREKVRRRREGSIWVSIIIGALIGCGLLSLVVLGLYLLASNVGLISNDNSTDGDTAVVQIGTTPSTTENGADDNNNADGLVIDLPTATPNSGRPTSQAGSIPPTETPETTATPLPIGLRDVVQNSSLFYFAQRDDSFEIFRRTLRNDDEIQLTADDSDNMYPSVSPDGRRVLFQSNRDGDFDIYTMNLAGGELRKLLDNDVDDVHPAWSPDGEWIVFASDAWRDGNMGLFRVRPDGSELEPLVANGQRNSHPRYSTNANLIVFVTGDATDARTWDIAILDADGEVTQVTDDNTRDAWPIISVDGRSVYYITGNGSDTRIVQRRIGTSAVQTLYDEDQHIWGLNLSPDGLFFAFNAGDLTDATGDVYLLPIDGSPATRVSTNGGVIVSWLP